MGEVAILGAGFSKVISPDMPILRELSQEVANEFESSLPSVPFLKTDLEMGLTFLTQSHPGVSESDQLRNKALFLDISTKIASVLRARMSRVLGPPSKCPQWLLKLAHWFHYKEATVLTLNYDTLLERAVTLIKIAEREGKPVSLQADDLYPVAFGWPPVASEPKPHPTMRLLKLHGSINWFYSGRPAYYGEPIHVRPVSGWRWVGEELIERWSGRVPLIVPPVAEKGGYFQHEIIRFLWSEAAAALRDAKRVICFGYSFPETDLTMRFLFHEAQPKHEVKISVVNTDKDVLERFRRMLPESLEIVDDWVGPNPERNLVEELYSELAAESNPLPVNGQGAVEHLIRQRLQQLPAGMSADGTSEKFTVNRFGNRSVELLLEGSVPCHVPWAALEFLYKAGMGRAEAMPLGWATSKTDALADPPDSVDAILKRYVYVAIARQVVTLLRKAGLAELHSDGTVSWTRQPN